MSCSHITHHPDCASCRDGDLARKIASEQQRIQDQRADEAETARLMQLRDQQREQRRADRWGQLQHDRDSRPAPEPGRRRRNAIIAAAASLLFTMGSVGSYSNPSSTAFLAFLVVLAMVGYRYQRAGAPYAQQIGSVDGAAMVVLAGSVLLTMGNEHTAMSTGTAVFRGVVVLAIVVCAAGVAYLRTQGPRPT